MADKVARRGVKVFIDGNEVENSVKAIKGSLQHVINAQAKMIVGSKEYVEEGKKIGHLSSILQQHREDLKKATDEYQNSTKGLKGFIDRMDELPGVMGWIGKSLTGVGDTFEMLFKNKLMLGFTVMASLGTAFVALVKHSMEFSKAVSELSALTGATGKDLDYLKNKAIELGAEYGKSATEIVTVMKLVGSAKPELLSNVSALTDVTRSILTLDKATGMGLTESTKNVTTIMNQFGLSAIESERTINVLAAGSKYGAVKVDYLGESISKVGTISKAAGLSLETTTAAMELFGEKGVKAEIAGNGFKKVLVELQSDSKNYTNGVFDLNKAIDNNQKISGDNIALQKKFGQEFFGLAQILFQNKVRFQELTTQVTGTDVAIEQMLIATDNLTGDVEKMSSSWDSFLLGLENGKGPLANASRWIVQLGKDAIDVLASLTKSDSQNQEKIASDSASRRINDTKQYFKEQSKLHQENLNQLEKELAKEKDIDKQKSIKQKIGVEKDKIENPKYKLDEINAQIIAEKHIYQQKQARMKQIESEISQNNQLGGAWKDNNIALQKESEGLRQSVKSSIAYTNALGGLKKAYKDTIKPPEKPSGGANAPDKSAAQKKKVDEAMQGLENDNIKALTAIKLSYLKGDIKTEYDYNKALLYQQDNYDELRKVKLTELLKTVTDPGIKLELNKQLSEIDKKALDRQIKQNNDIKKILLDADPIEAERQAYENRLRELGIFGIDKKIMTADQLEVLRILEEQHNANLNKLSTKQSIVELKQLDKDQQDAENLAANDRASGLLNEQQYKDELLSIEIDFLKKKLAINGLSADEIDKITKSLTQKNITASDKTAQEMSAFLGKYGLDELDQFKTRKETELKLLELYLAKGVNAQKAASKVKRILDSEEFELKTKGFKQSAEIVANISGEFSSAIQGFQSAEEKSIETKYQKQIDAAKKAGKDTTKLEDQKNKEIAAIRAKNADAEFALQVAQIIATTAVAAINSFASMSKIGGPILGGIAAAAAVAYGASQIAVAESAREAAKEGYYDGGFHNPNDKPDGFTGGSNPREVRGYFPDGQPYHGDEFISNHLATRNPNLRPFFNVIDEAQKNGTVSSLTKSDLAKALNINSTAETPTRTRTSVAGGNPNAPDNPIYAAMLARQAEVIEKLNRRLDEPFEAYSVISGKKGSFEQTKRYEKLIKNASR